MTQRRPLPPVTDVARTLARLTKGEHFGKSVAMRIDEPIAPLAFTLGTSRGPSSKYAYRDGLEDRIGHGSLDATTRTSTDALNYGIQGLLERPSVHHTTVGAHFLSDFLGDALNPPQTTRTSGEFFRVPPHLEDIDLFEILGHGSFGGTTVTLRGGRGTVLDSGVGGGTDVGDETIFTDAGKSFLSSIPNDGGGPAAPLHYIMIHIHGVGRFLVTDIVSNTQLTIDSGAGTGLSGVTYDIVAVHPTSLHGCTTAAASPIVTTIFAAFTNVSVGQRIFIAGAPDPFTVTHKTSSTSITVDRDVGVTHVSEAGSWYALGSKTGPGLAGDTTITSPVDPLFLSGVPGGISALRGYQGLDDTLMGGTPSGLDPALSLTQKYIKVMADCVFLWIEGHDRLYLLSNVSNSLVLHLGTTPAGGYYETILEVPPGTGGLQKDLTGFEAYMVFRAGASTYRRLSAPNFIPVNTNVTASTKPWFWGYLPNAGITAYCPAGQTLPATPAIIAQVDLHSLMHADDMKVRHAVGNGAIVTQVADWVLLEGLRICSSNPNSALLPYGMLDESGPMNDAAGNPIAADDDQGGSHGITLIDSLPVEVGPSKLMFVTVALTDAAVDLVAPGSGQYIPTGMVHVDVFYRRFRL